MNNEFVPYEIALALKELGFDEPCFGFYNNADGNVWIKHTIDESIKNIYIGDFEAPTFSQAFRWFREKYGLCASFTMNITCGWRICVLPNCGIYISSEFEKELYPKTYEKNSYEEAELECLKKLIEICQNK